MKKVLCKLSVSRAGCKAVALIHLWAALRHILWGWVGFWHEQGPVQRWCQGWKGPGWASCGFPHVNTLMWGLGHGKLISCTNEAFEGLVFLLFAFTVVSMRVWRRASLQGRACSLEM